MTMSTQELNANSFKQAFCDTFSIKELLNIFDAEVETIIKNIAKQEKQELKKAKENRTNIDSWKEISSKLLKLDDAREKFFTPYIPKTIQYIKDNILHSNDGNYYVISSNKETGLYPKEYKKEVIKDVYTDFFPPLVKKWFKSYHNVVNIAVDHLMPRRYSQNNQEYLNLFNGYPFDNIKRDDKIINSHQENIKTFLSHIESVLCSDNEIIYNEVKNWIYAFVGGKRKMKTALYLKGIKGAGKSILLNLISKCVGDINSINIQKATQILGEFNGHLAGKLFVYLDDTPLTYDQFSQLYGHLKVPITEAYNTYRDLFKTAISLKNISSYIICSNHPVLKLESSTGEERRFIICQVDSVLRSEEYFTKLWKIVENPDFQKAFYWWCQDNYDTEYNEQVSIKSLPKTETALEAIQASLSPVVEFIKSIIDDDFFNEPQKPKDVHVAYTQWYEHQPQLDKKKCKKYGAFCNELDTFPFIEIKTCRRNGEEKTNWLFFDKQGCLLEFKKRGYFSKYEDISNNEVDALLYYENRKQQLLKELAEVEEQLKVEVAKRNNDTEIDELMKQESIFKKRIDFSKLNQQEEIIAEVLKPIKKIKKIKKVQVLEPTADPFMEGVKVESQSIPQEINQFDYSHVNRLSILETMIDTENQNIAYNKDMNVPYEEELAKLKAMYQQKQILKQQQEQARPLPPLPASETSEGETPQPKSHKVKNKKTKEELIPLEPDGHGWIVNPPDGNKSSETCFRLSQQFKDNLKLLDDILHQ